MNNFIVMPDGNAFSPAVIKAVTYRKGGVTVRDAQTRILTYIPTDSDERGRLVRDLIVKAVNEGVKAAQPDWSFLEA